MTRTVLVTGSGRGLGSYIVKALSEKGFNVIINYNKSKEEAEKLQKEIGAQAIAIQADITDREAVEQLVKKELNISARLMLL